MANFAFTNFKRGLMEGEFDLNATDDIRVLMVMTNTTIDTEEDVTSFVSVTTLDEYDGSGYSSPGQALEGEVVAADTANDRGEFDATDEVFSTIGVGTRQAQAAVIYKFDTDLDTSIPLLYIDTGGFPFDGNGGDITFIWNAETILQLT